MNSVAMTRLGAHVSSPAPHNEALEQTAPLGAAPGDGDAERGASCSLTLAPAPLLNAVLSRPGHES